MLLTSTCLLKEGQTTHRGHHCDDEQPILQAAGVVDILLCLSGCMRCNMRCWRLRFHIQMAAMLPTLVPKELLSHHTRQRR